MLDTKEKILEFFNNLQYDPTKVSDLGLEVDNYSKPLPFKIYPNKKYIDFDTEIPSSVKELKLESYTEFQSISYMLWYIYGLSSFNWLTKNQEFSQVNSISFFRRSVASGGGLYPGELYIYIKGLENLKNGIYYMDVSGPRLVLIREGDFGNIISDSISEDKDNNIYIFITSFYWKNFLKYINFSYRLQGLDIGAIISQTYIISKMFGYKSKVNYLFNDNKINNLLGIDINEETSYAVISLRKNQFLHENINKESCGNIHSDLIEHSYNPPNHLYKNISYLNQLIAKDSINFKINKTTFEGSKIEVCEENLENKVYDVLLASRERVSPGEKFISTPLDLKVLQRVLNISLQEYLEVDIAINKYLISTSIDVYFYANKINGLEQGYYYYNQKEKNYELLKPGDYGYDFQNNLTRKNFNLLELPLIVHIAGDLNEFVNDMGYRGYRTLQMEVGRVMHQIQLNAAGEKLGSHPMLSFNAKKLEQIFDVKENLLIQIGIGNYDPLIRLHNDLTLI